MGMSRTQKEQEVKDLSARFSDNELIVVTHYSGLSVKEITNLRDDLREEGGEFKVTKNSLAKIAIKGTQFEGVADLFTGPTGVATSQDPVAAAKVAYKFAKANKNLIILGGVLGSKILDVKGVEALAKLPSLDEVRGKLVGVLAAPATQMARILQAPAQSMVGVTKAYSEKDE